MGSRLSKGELVLKPIWFDEKEADLSRKRALGLSLSGDEHYLLESIQAYKELLKYHVDSEKPHLEKLIAQEEFESQCG